MREGYNLAISPLWKSIARSLLAIVLVITTITPGLPRGIASASGAAPNAQVFLNETESVVEIGITGYQMWRMTKSGSDWGIEGVYTYDGTEWVKSFDTGSQFILGFGSKAQSYTILSNTAERKAIKFAGSWSNGGQHDFEYVLEGGEGNPWINVTASIKFADQTNVADKQFGIGMSTVPGTSLNTGVIFGYETKDEEKPLRQVMPAAAAVVGGAARANYLMINDWNETSDTWKLYVKKEQPGAGGHVELAQYTTAATYEAGQWYTLKSDIYIEGAADRKLNDLIGLAGDKAWEGDRFPSHILSDPLTPKIKNYGEAAEGVLTELLDPRAKTYIDGINGYRATPYYSTPEPFVSMDVIRGFVRYAQYTDDTQLLARALNDAMSLNDGEWLKNKHGGPTYLPFLYGYNGKFGDGGVNPHIGSYVKEHGITSYSTWVLYDPINSLGEIALLTGDPGVAEVFLRLTEFVRTLRWDGYKQALAYDMDTREPLPGEVGGAIGDGNGGGAGMWAYIMFLAYELSGDDSYLHDGYAALATIENMDYEAFMGHYVNSPKPNVLGWVIRALVKAYELSDDAAYLDKAEFVAQAMYSFAHFNSALGYDFPTYGWMIADSFERWDASREMAEALWIAAPLLQYRFVPTLAKIYLALKQTYLWTMPINENPRGMYDGYWNFEDPLSAYIPFEVPTFQGGIDGMERYGKQIYGAGEVFMLHQLFEAWAEPDDPQILAVAATSVKETFTDTAQAFRVYNPMAENKSFLLYFNGFAEGSYVVKADGVEKGVYSRAQLANGVSFTLQGGADALVEVALADSAPSDTTAPDPLTGVTAVANDKQQIAVSWNASSAPDFDHYIVYRSTEPNTALRKQDRLHAVSGNGYLDDDKDLVPGQTYYYSVVAVDSAGNAGNAAQAGATVMWRNFAWLERFENSFQTSDWSGVGAKADKHVYFPHWGLTDLRFGQVIRTHLPAVQDIEEPEAGAWSDHFDTIAGWETEDNMSFTASGGIGTLTMDSEKPGGGLYGAAYRTVSVDLDASPYLDMLVTEVIGTGATWEFVVSNGAESKLIQSNTSASGAMRYDIRSLTGWTGEVNLQLFIYVNGGVGHAIRIDEMGFAAAAAPEAWSDHFDAIAGWETEDNMSFTANNGIGTLMMDSEKPGGGLYGAAYQTVSANLDDTPYLDMRVTEVIGIGATWELLVRKGAESKLIQSNTSASGELRYDIRSLTGWTGEVNLQLFIYVNGGVGHAIRIDEMGFSGERTIPVWQDDFESTTGWEHEDTTSLAADNGIATLSLIARKPDGGYYGSAFKTVTANLDETPNLDVRITDVAGTDQSWSIVLNNGAESKVIQPNTSIPGQNRYNIKELTGWSGTLNLRIFIYINGAVGNYMKLDRIGFAPEIPVGDTNYVYKTVSNDLDQYPYIQMMMNSLQGESAWGLLVTDGTDTYTLQPDTRETGLFTYDVKAITGWSGDKRYDVRIKIVGTGIVTGQRASVDWIGATNGSALASGLIEDFSDVTDWLADETQPASLSTDGRLGTIAVADGSAGTAIRSATVDTDDYPFIRLKTAAVSEGAKWELAVGEPGSPSITVQPPTEQTGEYTYDLRSLTGWSGLKSFNVYLRVSGAEHGEAAFDWIRSDADYAYPIPHAVGEDSRNINMSLAQEMARHRTASADSNSTDAAQAIDGRYDTEWQSDAGGYPHWFSVDLGASRKIFQLNVKFGESFASDYQIQVSNDGSQWETVRNVQQNREYGWLMANPWIPPTFTINHTFVPTTARYVRLYATTGNSGSTTLRIADLEVYGVPAIPADLARDGSVMADSVSGASALQPSYAFDGNEATEWSSAATGYPHWLQVDLGEVKRLEQVHVAFGSAYATDYRIQVSANGSRWFDVSQVTGNNSAGLKTHDFEAIYGKYVRLYATAGIESHIGVKSMAVHTFADLARNRQASAGSGSVQAAKAFDYVDTTRWESDEAAGPHWLQIDLGASRSFSRVKLNFDENYAVDYSIQVSDDAAAWTDVANITGNASSGLKFHHFTAVNKRYVRLYATSGATSKLGVRTMEVNALLQDAAQGKAASADSVYGASAEPSSAVDGSLNSKWSSAATGYPHWLQADLGQFRSISEAVVQFGAAYASDYRIQVSPDGKTWTDVDVVVGNASQGLKVHSFAPVAARYVRLYATSGPSASMDVVRLSVGAGDLDKTPLPEEPEQPGGGNTGGGSGGYTSGGGAGGSPQVVEGASLTLTVSAVNGAAKTVVDEASVLQLIASAALTGGKTLHFILTPSEDVAAAELRLPASALRSAREAGIRQLAFDTGIGTATLQLEALEEALAAGSKELALSLALVSEVSGQAANKVGSRPVYDLNVQVDGAQVKPFKIRNAMKVELPYELRAGENPYAVVVYAIDESGQLTVVKNGRYDSTTGKVVFYTDRIGRFTALGEIVSFGDIQRLKWAVDRIVALAARGIVQGVGSDRFAPERELTRAEFIRMLVNALELKATGAEPTFSDVKASDWYYEALTAAWQLGIVSGYPDGTAGVGQRITREEMAAMVARAAKAANVELALVQEKASFADAAKISTFARQAVTQLQQAGIINGTGGGQFSPKTFSTRAQAAVIIYNIIDR